MIAVALAVFAYFQSTKVERLEARIKDLEEQHEWGRDDQTKRIVAALRSQYMSAAADAVEREFGGEHA